MAGYGTVYSLLRALPDSLMVLAHQGTRAYSEIFDMVHRREACRCALQITVSSPFGGTIVASCVLLCSA
jgi:hypothetical protein